MRLKALLGLTLVMALAAPAFGQSFVGEWTATATTATGKTTEIVKVFKVGNGFVITAKLIGVPDGTPEAGPGTDIVLDGDHFSYKRSLTLPNGAPLVITYSGVVSGDTFTGTADLGFAKTTYSGVRIKHGS